jgi:cell division transport system permease protein
MLGLKGGAIGGGAALVLFGLLEAVNAWISGTPGGEEAAALFGNFSVGASGYVAIVALIVLMALVTALASRRTVNQTLESID